MDDVETRAREIIAEYGDLTTGEEAQIQEFKQGGAGLPQERPRHAAAAAPGSSQAHDRLGPPVQGLPDKP